MPQYSDHAGVCGPTPAKKELYTEDTAAQGGRLEVAN